MSKKTDRVFEQAMDRRAELQREIARVFPELERVSVEFGGQDAVSPDFGLVRAYRYSVNLYRRASMAPDLSLVFNVVATDEMIQASVERALATLPPL